MPMNKSLYPANWKEISAQIRVRAGNKCEVCGVPNGVWIVRDPGNLEQYTVIPLVISEADLQQKFNSVIKVILTVAHLDHDTTNNTDSNLACLCQLHHLRHDAKLHAMRAAITRETKQARIQPRLFD